MNITDVTPFGPLIIKAHYNFNWDILKPICQNMINGTSENVHIENENGKSSVYNFRNQPHLNPHFDPFYNWLYPIVQHIIKNEWKYEPSFKYNISNSWVNMHTKNGITYEHHHGPAIAVVATYLQLEPGMGYIEYKDPLEYQKGINLHEDMDDWVWKKIPAQTGDVLIFPGWIRHRTETSQSLKERWVLTTNIITIPKP